MAKKSGLGRGLDALLPDYEEALTQIDSPILTGPEDERDLVREIPINAIDPNPDQPRRTFDPETLAALAASIAANGVLSPILVARGDGKRYTIIDGERRWRAARQANLETIPAIVRDWDEIKRQEAALIENIQRDDLNAIEEAAGIAKLMQQYSFTQEQAAERLGKSRPAVANLLRLLTLPEVIRNAVIDGSLTAGHARVLAGIDDKARQLELFTHTLRMGWSVRQLEAAAKEVHKEKNQPRPKPDLPVEYESLLESIRSATGLKAEISGTKAKGRIILEYADEESLQRLWELFDTQS